ncbi:MAG: excinuclease ABC subunit UvrB [Simkaniaceae bacterium]
MFKLVTDFKPTGDQPQAIEKLTRGLDEGKKSQVLLGVTGSGKTFTMANIIAKCQRPTLILAHNKTLAAQLYQEFKGFFPENAVEYFVSYYDYYQPEAYIARSDTYIEKDLSINDNIDKMRHSATRSLIERDDVIIISSVSCIYGLGSPEHYRNMKLIMEVNKEYRRDDILLHLIELHYERNDIELSRGKFRVRGDILEIVPSYEEDLAYRLEFFDEELERISEIDPLTGRVLKRREQVVIYPGSHHVTPNEVREDAIETISTELVERANEFALNQRFIEEQRINERTKYDLEMIKEIGFCKGIENYSRHFSKRGEGEPSACLIDYFPENYLLFIDESHVMIPQVRAMYNGDRSRKESLIEFGFRLPSAYDNRPLKFEEFDQRVQQVIYVSATPAPFEVEKAGGEIVQQIIRPTGLLDPNIEIRRAEEQVDDVLEEIRVESGKGGRILVTTLTKKLAEDLSKYLSEIGVKAKYLHSDIETIERIQIINELREGRFDVLVGINLLREGLDIPEVTLVAILDADKEGFLRSQTALIQTCGRAARNRLGRVIMYADKETNSIKETLRITKERRSIQEAYNLKHGIIPKSVTKSGPKDLKETFFGYKLKEETQNRKLKPKDIRKRIEKLESEMKAAAKEWRFEEAARLRDEVRFYQNFEILEDASLLSK